MNTLLKIVLGILLTIGGVYSSLTFWPETLVIMQGMIGPILVLVGIFIIWLESDNWKQLRSGTERDSIQERLSESAEQITDTNEPESEESDMHSCPICGKEFDTERGMRIHKTQKHG